MLDFVKVSTKQQNGALEVLPSFKVIRSKDIMIRGNSFYAIWDEDLQKWSTDEFEAIKLIDQATLKYSQEKYGENASPQLLINADNCLIDKWKKYCQKQAINNYIPLDETLMFANMPRKRECYSSRQLSYPLEQGDYSAWDRLVSVLYDVDERHKIEWAIGSIVKGDSKYIQKFMVFYGGPGTGKSTILNIVQQMFDGYYSVFDAKALGSNNNSFALESFRSNPLVALQHDGDLSKIEDNTKLNSLVSHEEMTINEKFKSAYTNSFKAFLMMGTNKPVKISDAKSGLIRRLIDVSPTGKKIGHDEYFNIMDAIPFQLSGIAQRCLDVYSSDPKYYNAYVPTEMFGASNDFYNFISDNYETFAASKDVPLNLGWEIYKNYIEDANMPYPLSKRAFREEFKNYFDDFKDRYTLPDGKRARSYYIGFLDDKFNGEKDPVDEVIIVNDILGMNKNVSLFDIEYSTCIAQYAVGENGIPAAKWDIVNTKLSNINTSELHYVRVPINHIVIDFDIPGEDGEKNLEKNLEAASKWPKTYSELSKSGSGIHLHYIYSGDANMLSRVFEEHIEIKVFVGNSSLRRRLTMCNETSIATISSGLPLKEERKNVVNKEVITNEKKLRVVIIRALKKEYNAATKPNVDLINKLLTDTYASGTHYDITDLRPSILSFAATSTHQAEYCLKIVNNMKYKSEEASEDVDSVNQSLVFYDIEVFKNLFLVNWKFRGKDKKVIRMINPTPVEIERLCQFNLVGFNNRRYDNHIMYGRMMGYDNMDLYRLSKRIIDSSPNAMFAEAYNLSYTDVFDFASAPNKRSLKKWEIELGIKHHELGLSWDEEVPEELWLKVAEYCDDDVLATEAVFDHLESDFKSRTILAEIAGKSVNTSTNALTTAIVFGGNKTPQKEFNYRDLAKPIELIDIKPDMLEYLKDNTLLPLKFTAWDGTQSALPCFPGYKYEFGKSTYRGYDVGEGGWVYSEPGYHEDVALLDVTSMHPNSTNNECLFGPRYTRRYYDLVDGRTYIKHGELEKLKSILDGKFAPYAIDNKKLLKELSTSLKTPINAVYGLTSASFANAFKDERNIDNIGAKRGALFMIDLKFAVESQGFTVAHIKTDSIKIPNATPAIIEFVNKFGRTYGYGFEHEATYGKICLVNNAVYVAKYASEEKCQELYGYIPADNYIPADDPDHSLWTATGTQFAVPYVHKTLFTHELITISDMCETKSVKTAIYLDFNESLPEEEHDRVFIGKVGSFSPVKENCGGGLLVREAMAKDGTIKYDSVTGTKGFRWVNGESIKELDKEDSIDKRYYQNLVDEAMTSIGKYCDAEAFIS